MNPFKKLFKRNSTPVYDQYFARLNAGADVAGVTVSATTAESISAVYAAISAISESLASLPLNLYQRTDEGRQKARQHPLYKLLHDAPNDRQTALEFREMMQRHVLLRGNAYAEVIWDANGQPKALEPLHPDHVTILRNDAGSLIYQVTDWKGKVRRLLSSEMLHLRYHTDDGIIGVSPIQKARETIGLALAERNHGGKMFEHGTKLSGVIEMPAGSTKEQAGTVRDAWTEGYSSVNNHGKTAVLPQGATFKTVSMTLEDAEWIEARRLSVEEVARLFRVPPVLIGDLREANYSNAVELGRYFVTHTLKRHLVMWEQAISRTLINDTETYFAEHNVEGLLRGDSLTRAQFYNYAIRDRWMKASEVRELENLKRIEGIDDEEPQAQQR